MSELHSGLRLFRAELIEAIDREHGRTWIRAPRLRWLLAPAVAGAAVMTAVILVAGGTRTSSADAATLRRIGAALTPAPGTILHERALVTRGDDTPQIYELWQQASDPSAARWIKFGHELSSDGTNMSVYDSSSNTITVTADEASASTPAVDLAQVLRSLADAGSASVDGVTTLNGISVYKLTVHDAPGSFENGTAYVARETYFPVLIESRGGSCNCDETIRFQAYEYLPGSRANLRLLDLPAQHPGARVVTTAPRGTTKTPR